MPPNCVGYIASGPAAAAPAADAVPAPREDFVRVGLVAHVKNDLVLRSVKHVVQRHRQLNDTQRGPEMSSRARHRVDSLRAQLLTELPELLKTEFRSKN